MPWLGNFAAVRCKSWISPAARPCQTSPVGCDVEAELPTTGGIHPASPETSPREPLSVGQVRHLIPRMGTPHLAAPEKLKARSVGVAQTFFGSGRPTLPQPCRDAGDPINADQPHHQREPLPRCERAGQRLQLQDPDTPAQPPFGPQDGTDPDCRRPTHQTSERRISGSKAVRRKASRLQAPGSG